MSYRLAVVIGALSGLAVAGALYVLGKMGWDA